MEPGSLRVEDYVIIVLMLVISAAIGLYYSVVKRKQDSTTEYFLASRNMGVAPMALSYFATTVATGTMIGFPVEIYNYGAQIFIQIITIPFVIWTINQLVIPIFYSMKTACIFKYFEVRFSRGLACTVAGTSIINMICHSSVTLYGASIALEQATGLNWWVISSIMAAVCILYSTMGGIRGIIITDAVQAFTMLSSIVILVVMGVIGSNGIAYIWQISYANDRLNFFNFDVDPRTRHTFWTATIGYGLLSLATSTSQSFIQRFLVASNVRKAQCANSLGVGMLIFQWLVCGCLGLIIFAFYHGCNIMTTGLITNANQLAPYFAKSIFSPYRCLSGIYFGALVSASLSTISSALNSTSAVIVETFIKPARPYMSDRRITIICKMTVLISGVITLVSISMVDQFPNLIQASIVVFSIFSAPLFMLYLIGIFCPQANTKIATFSFVFSLLITLWIAIGNVMLKTVNQPKPFLNDNCDMVIGYGRRTNNSFILPDWTNSTSQLAFVKLSSNSTNVATPPTTSKLLARVFPFSSVSYQWYSLIGMTSCLISFVVLTFVFGSNDDFKSLDDDDKDLIPDVIKKLHLKIKRKYRRIFLCDIYDK